MNTKKKANLYLVLIVLLTALLIASPFVAGIINKAITKCPDVVNGTIDFKGTKITNTNPLYLSGEWVKYSGHIISGSSSSNGVKEIIPPRLTTNMFSDEGNLGSTDSYKITLKNLNFKNAVIYIPHFAGSYRVFINGKLTAFSGNFKEQNTYANLKLSSIPIDFDSNGVYDVVIETSCELMPGIYMTPIIAGYDYTETYKNVTTSIRCLIIGIVFVCGIYVFAYSRSKNAIFTSRWLPLLFILIALRMTISTEGFTAFGFLFPKVNYEHITLLICISTFIIKLVALLFYTETLDLNIGKGTFVTICLVFLGCAVITSLFPFTVFNPYYYIILQAATLPLDIVLLGKLTNCIARKVRFSTLYTFGYVAIISGIMVDCFYTNGLISFNASSFMPATFCIFVVAFAIMFSMKISEVYKSALRVAELDRELTNANTALMISQIQPHFLYNALNTIKYLIKREPKLAEKAVISFSRYLRGNMESLSQKSPIPFNEELDHIKNYCEIELLRFGDKLDIIYNIKCSDFEIPSLSIQPLVENAIKHGVTKNPNGGTVTVSTDEDSKNHYVIVNDNGIGFDTDNLDYTLSDEHAHLGIENVEKRLKNMVNATLKIESTQNEGTTVTVTIPKEEN